MLSPGQEANGAIHFKWRDETLPERSNSIMNEKPDSIWNRPWRGPLSVILWFLILCSATVVVVFVIGLLWIPSTLRDTLHLAVVAGVCFPLLGLLLFWLVRWLFRWRNFRRVLFGIACLATLIALAWVEEDVRGKWAWNKFKGEWEAKGERFDMAAFIPPPVPDNENFALTPLLRPALEYIRGTNGTRWLDTNAYGHLQRVRADLQPDHSTNNLTLGKLDIGTLADLETCRVFYRGNTNYPQPARPGTAAQDILVALGTFDADLRELQNAAATRPYSRFPIEYNSENPFAILLPHLSSVKQLCILAELRCIARLETGDAEGAFADLNLGFTLSDSVRDEPLLIDHLVRIACLNLTLQGLREGLVRHAWSDAQLAGVEKRLASVNLPAEYKKSIRCERACCITTLQYLSDHRFKSRGEEIGLDGIPPMPRGWYYQNMLAISRMDQRFTLDAVDEQKCRFDAQKVDEGEQLLNKMRRTPYNWFAKELVPAISGATRKSARAQVYLDAARIACALERHRLSKGDLPDTLKALVPAFIDRIPEDVIDGKPLRYRRTSGGGYVVYSVGWNRTDDGGTIGWTADKKSADVKTGDWVWQMPGK
jgi:hypothetical protein